MFGEIGVVALEHVGSEVSSGDWDLVREVVVRAFALLEIAEADAYRPVVGHRVDDAGNPVFGLEVPEDVEGGFRNGYVI